MSDFPRFMISAAHKSSGKTVVSMGLSAAFRAAGDDLATFKKGPDYIDPMWLGAASGRACYNLDFNTMTLDSDWTVTLATGDPNDEAQPPQVGLVFRGPLGTPSRIIDVLQFSSYLNIRQEQRIQEILAQEEEARLENDRFKRERRKLKEDADRREREAQAQHEALALAASNLEALHVSREIAAEERAVAELAEAQARAAAMRALKVHLRRSMEPNVVLLERLRFTEPSNLPPYLVPALS